MYSSLEIGKHDLKKIIYIKRMPSTKEYVHVLYDVYALISWDYICMNYCISVAGHGGYQPVIVKVIKKPKLF